MDATEEIKSRLNIEDVISEYIQLKRSGRNFKGLSPFTSEKSPSFMVSPEKQIWHDFSSGKGGNMFSFVMEMEGLDFKGALELLARKAGVDLGQYQGGRAGSNTKIKERLYEVLELAAKFYQIHFSKNNAALEYVLKKRGFSKETALNFRLGYSPAGGTALCDFLKKQGFSDKEIRQAGLATKGYRDARDMFRGRIMIPLQDPQGKVIGFTARLLEDEPNAPKYINTPQTILYDKGRHVYGLHLAKEAIRRNKYTVVVEGNLDVIASHQAGVKQVVATAGTAITEMHLKALSRFSGDIRLAFDEDQAGQNATERAIPIASKVGVSLSIVSIPSGKDPDELIKKDPKLWEDALDKYEYAMDWLIRRYQKQLDLNSAQGKRQFTDVLLGVARQINDSVEQDHYLQEIARIIGVSADALRSKLNQNNSARTLKKRKTENPKPDENQAELIKTQDHLLALVLLRPSLRSYLDSITEEMLLGKEASQLFAFLREHPDFKGDKKELEKLAKTLQADAAQGAAEQRTEPYLEYGEGAEKAATQRSAASSDRVGGSADKQATTMQGFGEYVKIVTLIYESLYQDIDELELSYEAAHLQKRLIELYVKSQKRRLAEELREADEANDEKLLKQVKELDQLLKSIGGAYAEGQQERP